MREDHRRRLAALLRPGRNFGFVACAARQHLRLMETIAMRLNEKQKQLVLDAARVHIVEPSLVRVGVTWGVVGKDVEDPRRWSGLVVARIEWSVEQDRERVWWSDHTFQLKRRSDVIRALNAAVQ